MPNQYKPLPPEDELRPWITLYYNLRRTDRQTAELCLLEFDPNVYGLSERTVRRLRGKWGLTSTRQQKHTLESISQAVLDIKKTYPQRGARKITDALWLQKNIRAPRELVEEFLKMHEPEAVERRRHGRLKRRRYWSAGVNDVWAQDQHDKWMRFGLFMHSSIEVHSGFINWMKIWWTNKNPRLVAKYYLDFARNLGAVPLITQSDPGTENYGVANLQTLIRRQLDPSLQETLQHRWMRKHTNIKPEIHWSMWRRDGSPGFENILDHGVNSGWYDPSNELERLVFLWLAIPWLQTEIDSWVHQQNVTSRRANRNKILPHGIPALIVHRPERYGASDFKVHVPEPMPLFDALEEEFAPPDHPVFNLVPPPFDRQIKTYYCDLGEPPVDGDTFWNVYNQVLSRFQSAPANQELVTALASSHSEDSYDDVPQPDRIPLLPLPAFRPAVPVPIFSFGPEIELEYQGGADNPQIPSFLQTWQSEVNHESEDVCRADFTDEEDSDSDEEY